MSLSHFGRNCLQVTLRDYVSLGHHQGLKKTWREQEGILLSRSNFLHISVSWSVFLTIF